MWCFCEEVRAFRAGLAELMRQDRWKKSRPAPYLSRKLSFASRSSKRSIGWV
jgi:hypothetical protein